MYVGLGSEADVAGRDVRGKAVLFIRSQFAYNVGPADVLSAPKTTAQLPSSCPTSEAVTSTCRRTVRTQRSRPSVS